MKLTITVNRKCGAPNYGSDGAGAELVLEVPDNDPAALQAIGGAWYGHLEKLVDAQVVKMQATHQGGGAAPVPPIAPQPQQHAYVPPMPPAMPGPVAGGPPAGYQAPPIAPAPVPSGPPAGGDGGRNDAPRTGKQLLGWANKVGKYDMLMTMAKSWNRGKVVEWTADDVAHAYQHLARPEPQAWGG